VWRVQGLTQIPPLRYPGCPVDLGGLGALPAALLYGRAHTRACPVQRGWKAGYAPVGGILLFGNAKDSFLDELSSRPERSVAEGSAVRHSAFPNFPWRTPDFVATWLPKVEPRIRLSNEIKETDCSIPLNWTTLSFRRPFGTECSVLAQVLSPIPKNRLPAGLKSGHSGVSAFHPRVPSYGEPHSLMLNDGARLSVGFQHLKHSRSWCKLKSFSTRPPSRFVFVSSWIFRGFARLAGLDRFDIDPGSPKIGCRKRLLRTTNIATSAHKLIPGNWTVRASIAQTLSHKGREL
jgi:hypothetical protein